MSGWIVGRATRDIAEGEPVITGENLELQAHTITFTIGARFVAAPFDPDDPGAGSFVDVHRARCSCGWESGDVEAFTRADIEAEKHLDEVRSIGRALAPTT